MNTIALPFPLIGPTPTLFEADTAGYAVDIVQAAAAMCLKASYHPCGGETAKANYPVTHAVYVSGNAEEIAALRRALAKKSETS